MSNSQASTEPNDLSGVRLLRGNDARSLIQNLHSLNNSMLRELDDINRSANTTVNSPANTLNNNNNNSTPGNTTTATTNNANGTTARDGDDGIDEATAATMNALANNAISNESTRSLMTALRSSQSFIPLILLIIVKLIHEYAVALLFFLLFIMLRLKLDTLFVDQVTFLIFIHPPTVSPPISPPLTSFLSFLFTL
jgi:hypothetical protein